MSAHDIITAFLILLAALLYASVGHAGASGYLAVMALMTVPPEQMKVSALGLNVLVAMIATVRFYRAGAFSARLFWPLAVASVPMAYIGGTLTLPGHIYKPVVGVLLIYAAVKSFATAKTAATAEIRSVATPILLAVGAALGLLSGLTGVGGGIFLSPILIFYRWASTKIVSGVAAAFILVNSIAALAGVLTNSYAIPSSLPLWAVAALLGGFIGAEFGSRRLGNPNIQRLLALVLLIAGIKMMLTAAS
ncbi:sulfite exporter TauE/SafE family protein [Rhodoferax bucti]|uniref:sulfite exporter TauE/SafE family protein n=1 Tax=Rhodoferax bucti TaxID=2576305 RepID=UPI0011085859|nr:sulfite exporter TauE/SafE family protein [Rhodoferax bucti]